MQSHFSLLILFLIDNSSSFSVFNFIVRLLIIIIIYKRALFFCKHFISLLCVYISENEIRVKFSYYTLRTPSYTSCVVYVCMYYTYVVSWKRNENRYELEVVWKKKDGWYKVENKKKMTKTIRRIRRRRGWRRTFCICIRES